VPDGVSVLRFIQAECVVVCYFFVDHASLPEIPDDFEPTVCDPISARLRFGHSDHTASHPGAGGS